jgi:hypothetical protein
MSAWLTEPDRPLRLTAAHEHCRLQLAGIVAWPTLAILYKRLGLWTAYYVHVWVVGFLAALLTPIALGSIPFVVEALTSRPVAEVAWTAFVVATSVFGFMGLLGSAVSVPAALVTALVVQGPALDREDSGPASELECSGGISERR